MVSNILLLLHGRRHFKLFTNCHVSWDTLYFVATTLILIEVLKKFVNLNNIYIKTSRTMNTTIFLFLRSFFSNYNLTSKHWKNLLFDNFSSFAFVCVSKLFKSFVQLYIHCIYCTLTLSQYKHGNLETTLRSNLIFNYW